MADQVTAKDEGAKFTAHRLGGRPVMSLAQATARFWDHAIPEPNTGCWFWTGRLTQRGYGDTGGLSVTRWFPEKRYAHRLAFALSYGPIPAGMHVCHRCDVRSCVNPEHLFLGTAQTNNDDKTSKGRSRGRFSGATHCVNGHEFSPDNTAYRKDRSKRECRACWRIRNQQQKAKQVNRHG